MSSRLPKLLTASRDALLDSWLRGRSARPGEPDRAAACATRSRAFTAIIDLVARHWEHDPAPSAEALPVTPGTPSRDLRDSCAALVDRGAGPGDLVGLSREAFDVVERFLLGIAASPRRQLEDLRRLRALDGVVTGWILRSFDAPRPGGRLADAPCSPPTVPADDQAFAQLYSATTDIILLIDADGRIRGANPEASVRFGNVRLSGRHVDETLGLETGRIRAMSRDLIPGQVSELTLAFGAHHRHFGVRVLPWRVADDDAGLMVLLNDITCLVDQREALEAEVDRRTNDLVRSETMLESILESVGEGVLVTDQDQEITRANAQASEIFGLAWENLIGTPIRELIAARDRDRLDGLAANLSPHQTRNSEVVGLYVDGREFPAAFTVTCFDLDGRRWYGYLARDITEQTLLERRLRTEKRQCEDMNVTLRNVLNTIESERLETERRLAARVRDTMLPALAKAQRQGRSEIRASYLDLVRDQLVALTEGCEGELDGDLLKLSRMEVEVCRFIRSGASSKDIGEALHLSLETVQTHRKNIRRKLGLRGRGVNLHNYLQSKRALGERDAGQGGGRDVGR